MKDKLQMALEYATKKHDGQFRKEGIPYISHPIAVAEYVRDWGYDESYQIAALFHDLLEDTDATETEIEDIGGKEVLQTVKLLTKKESYVMSDYVNAIKKNQMAMVVKTADRLHNLRSAVHTDNTFKRRYIAESKIWYADFSPEIEKAIEELSTTL